MNRIFNKNRGELEEFIIKQTKQQIDDYDMKVETTQRIFEKDVFRPYFKEMILYVIVKDEKILADIDNTSDANKPVSSATQTALDLKANLANPRPFSSIF
jgi:hypothetical protein